MHAPVASRRASRARVESAEARRRGGARGSRTCLFYVPRGLRGPPRAAPRPAARPRRAEATRASAAGTSCARSSRASELGSTTERMTVASSRSAMATPKPICWNITSFPAREAGEDDDDDQRRAGDDPGRRRDASDDRVARRARRVVPLLDPAHQEHLVVHRQPEQHREEEERNPRVDHVRVLEAEQAGAVRRRGRRASAGRTRRRPRAG